MGTPTPADRSVVIVAYLGVQILDVVGPHEVFAAANKLREPGTAGYRIDLRSPGGGDVVSESGIALAAAQPLARPPRRLDTLLVAGGDGVQEARNDTDLIDWIATAAGRARRYGSICSGTFLLADAGLLNGRRATTHWARAERLAREFPSIEVDPDPIHIEDGPAWTSAGVTAGIDLALALVEADHGPALAQHIGQWLVMFLRRPGGQSQFAPPAWAGVAEHGGVRAAVERIHADPAADLSVAALAQAAAMSARNFTRVFTRELGCPPARYVEQVRIAAARNVLETTSMTIDGVARTCGFGTAETLRRSFIRAVGVPPGSYRRGFTHNDQTTGDLEVTA